MQAGISLSQVRVLEHPEPSRAVGVLRDSPEVCILGAPSPLIFLNFLQWIFSKLLSKFLFNFERKSPQNSEKFARFQGGQKRVKSCRISGCHGFFGSPRTPSFFELQSVWGHHGEAGSSLKTPNPPRSLDSCCAYQEEVHTELPRMGRLSIACTCSCSHTACLQLS